MMKRLAALLVAFLFVLCAVADARIHHGSSHGGGGGPLTITGISLSGASFTGGASSGTVVGTIGVTATGGSFSGSLSLTGANASSFQIVGTNLETSGVVAAGSYAINIVATQSGAVGSPFTQAESITGSSGTLTITGISLTGASFIGGSPSGTIVGNISVTATGGSFAGSLSLTGTNASSFQIVGNSLETSGVVATGSYSLNIIATQGGAVGSPFTQAETLTGNAPGSNTIADAAHSTSAEVGQYLQFTLAWGGTVPTGISSSTWSGGGGAGTVTAFSHTGPLVQFWTSVPASAGTYSLAIIADNGATATVTGISIAAPGNDAAAFPTAGIYGPDTATIGEGSGGDNNQFQNQPIAQYFARKFVGPPVISFTATAGHTGAGNSVCTKANDGVTFGDQYCFETQPMWGPEGAGQVAGFVLCASQQMASDAYQAAFYIDVTLTDSATGTAYTKHVVIDHPHDPYVYFYGARVVIPQSGNNTQIGVFGLMLDSMLADESGANVVVGLLNGHAASLTFTDASGLFTYSNGTSLGGEVLILKSKLISANFGDHTFTVAAAGGATVTYHVYIAHEYQPQIGYFPNGTLYSSNPVTNGFGSWPIAKVRAYNDAHGAAHEWNATHFTMLSDSSGSLNLWDTGDLFLTAPISAGTINASFSAKGLYGQTTTMVLALPVTAGTTLTGALTGVITPSLENYVGYSNFQQAANCPACAPLSVIALTASGITPVWGSTTIDVMNMGGTMVSNVQLPDGGSAANQDTNLFAARHNPRYVLSGASGSTATVKANDLSAINHDTPQVDPVVITVTDGNGTFDTETFNLSVAWVQRAVTEITVGPSNANYPSPTYPDMYHAMQAMTLDYNANGQAATMAGVSIRLLRGVIAEAATPSSLGGTTGWDYCPAPGGGSGYTCGRYPFPVQLKGDDSQQAAFTGAISTTNLTVTGSDVSKPGIWPGDYIDSGVGSLKVMVISQTSGTTHYNGVYAVHIGPAVASATASVSATAMTTKMPRTFLNFAGRTVPGGSQQGCIMLNGGYDVDVKGLEITGCQNSYSGTTYNPGGQSQTVAAIWTSDGARGNLSLRDSYIYDSGNGILNSGFGAHFLIDRSMFFKNGDKTGGAHNIYASSSASFTMTNSVSCDTLTVHDVKTRAAYNRINHNVFCDGINGAGSVPVEITVGGDTIVDSNIILKPANSRAQFNGIIVQLAPELFLVGQDGFPTNWPYTNMRVTNNSILASTPLANNLYPSARGVVAWGWTKTYGTPTFVDEVRNRPALASASGNRFWHMPDGTTGGLGTTEWRGTENGGVVTDGGGNTTLTTYPASAMEIVDLLTGTPPFHLPPPGACGCLGQNAPWNTGSVASAPGVYGVSLVVPDGSPDGTLVGHLAATGADWAVMTGPPAYSLVNISTSNNNSMFRLVPSGNGVDVVTNGTISAASCLAPGVCAIEIQGVGAGFNYAGAFSSPFTASQVLAVVVGNYN